jgi:hypothetical protein
MMSASFHAWPGDLQIAEISTSFLSFGIETLVTSIETSGGSSTCIRMASKSDLHYDSWFTANQFVMASSPLINTTTEFFLFSTEPLW